MMRDGSRRTLSLLAVVLVLACAAVVAGCGGSSSSSSSSKSEAKTGTSTKGTTVPKETIGYIEPAAVDEVTSRNAQQMEAAAKALGWELKYTNAQGDIAKTVAAMENDINSGVSAIIVGSEDAKLVRQPLLAAQQKGIPAIVIGGEVEKDPLYAAQYTENEALMSKLLTEQMVKNLGGKGEIGAIEIGELSSGVNRAKAREEVLKGTGVTVADSKEGSLENPIQGTKQIASAMLTAHPNLSAMWLVYDYMMPPTVEAMESLGNKSTQIYTWFAGPENAEKLRTDPQVKALVEDNFDHTALIAMDQLAAHFATGATINPNALEECPLKYKVVEKSDAPPPGKLIWPVEQNRAPFETNWKAGKFGKGADCGTNG